MAKNDHQTVGEIDDPRFQSVHTDPRFVRQPNKKKFKNINKNGNKNDYEEQDAGCDARFKILDKKSKKNKSDDKQSKKKKDSRTAKNIPKFIDYARGEVLLESSDEDEDDDDDDGEGYLRLRGRIDFDSSDHESSSEDEEEEIELGPSSSSKLKKRKRDYDSIDEIDLNEDDDDDGQESGKELDQIPPTRRIAVVNLDWDNVKPIDIFKVFSSLVSSTAAPSSKTSSSKQSIVKGQVLRVTFYKSKFGKERMKKEDVEGPPREIFKKPDTSSSSRSKNGQDYDFVANSDDGLIEEDEGDEFDEEALRKYQLDRLRYFYAIVELDSVEAAKHAYDEIDGTEFERTANVFDLSFVPDEMLFDPEDLHDECLEDSNDYTGVDFSTDALRHSKVKLTWDSEDPHRAKITRLNTQKMKREEIDKMDYSNLVAPPSSEEEERDDFEEEDKGRTKIDKDRLRKLLGLDDPNIHRNGLGENNRSSVSTAPDLNITFTPAFSNQNSSKSRTSKIKSAESNLIENSKDPSLKATKQLKKLENKNTPKSKTGDDDDESQDEDEEESEEDAGKARPSNKEELELLFDDDDEEIDKSHKHFDLNQIVKIEKLKNKPKALKRLKKDEKLKSLVEKTSNDRFKIDTDDNRFSKVFDDFEYAIDPSNPQYKPTSNMEKLLEVTRKKRTKNSSLSSSSRTAVDQSKSNSSSSYNNNKYLSKEEQEDADRLRIGQLMNSLKNKSS